MVLSFFCSIYYIVPYIRNNIIYGTESEECMNKRFLVNSMGSFIESNIYADRASIVLDWLLRIGIDKEHFSLREVVRDLGSSLGCVQRTFATLTLNGILKTEGVRTAKSFHLYKPEQILNHWIEHYSIVKKCKMWNYRSGIASKEEMMKAIKKSDLSQKVAFALHSAAEVHRCKNTNFETLELYMLEPNVREKLEKILYLKPVERGYEVLLIEPYYKSLLKHLTSLEGEIRASPILLTFLDLYHFPLRGMEQAEFIKERLPELKRIYKKG